MSRLKDREQARKMAIRCKKREALLRRYHLQTTYEMLVKANREFDLATLKR